MKKQDVPQDNTQGLSGHRKAMYSLNEQGEYEITASSGWEVEETVLEQAVDVFNKLTAQARNNVVNGISSPLEYHMYAHRMDIPLLAQTTGFFQWQIKRHLKPQIFTRLSQKKLRRYSDALDLSIDQLHTLPQE